MEIEKEILRSLKRTKKYFEKEDLLAIKQIVEYNIEKLENAIKYNEERTEKYINKLVEELK